MRAAPLAALGIAAYAAFLVATMPAAFVLSRAQQALPGKLEVREAIGTAWHGAARVVATMPAGDLPVERLEWHWRPARLAAARFAFDIFAEAKGLRARFEGARAPSQWEARDLEVRGDAAALAALLPWLAAWRPEGTVRATSALLATDGVEVRGDARVEWRGAAVALSDVKPLGSYRADIHAEGHAGRVEVSTLEGRLQVAGHGTLTPPTQFAFRGEARAEGADARALDPLLNLLGPARADGTRTLDWQAR
jgi:general secretion pathway protein N